MQRNRHHRNGNRNPAPLPKGSTMTRDQLKQRRAEPSLDRTLDDGVALGRPVAGHRQGRRIHVDAEDRPSPLCQPAPERPVAAVGVDELRSGRSCADELDHVIAEELGGGAVDLLEGETPVRVVALGRFVLLLLPPLARPGRLVSDASQ